MAHQEQLSVSSAIEDCAKAIYSLEFRAGAAVSTNAVAERLGVTPTSASGMIKRLGELGLVQSLGVPWDRVHAEAEVLEHVLSEELEELIAAKLGDPTHDPHGDPIPTRELTIEEGPTQSLQSLAPGAGGTFRRVSDSDPDMLRFLAERGIAPGGEVRGTRQAVVRRPSVRPLRPGHPRPRWLTGACDARGDQRVNPQLVTLPPPVTAPAGATGDGLPLELLNDAPSPLERLLARGRRRATLAMLGPAFVASIALLRPREFRHQPAGGRPLRLPAAVGGAGTPRARAAGRGGAALAFAVALLASGASSSSVGTYCGQVVMAGFVNLRIPLLARRAVTMVPALVVLALGVSPTSALILSQVVLSFGVPFALVPLVILTGRRDVMGVQAPPSHQLRRLRGGG